MIAGCNQKKTNYETEGPFIEVTGYKGGEINDLESFPRIHAVYESGKLKLYSEMEPDRKIVIGDDAPVYEQDISDEDVEQIKTLIEKNNFWKLDEYLPDDGALDADSRYITVHLTDESKTVGGYSPAHSGFSEISRYVSGLVDYEDYKQWADEMEEHIQEMNPDF